MALSLTGPTARLGTVAVLAALACAGTPVLGAAWCPVPAQGPGGREIHTVSTRPDTVTGGDVLVQIKFAGITSGRMAITLHAHDVTAAFKPTRDSNIALGLVRDLSVEFSRCWRHRPAPELAIETRELAADRPGVLGSAPDAVGVRTAGPRFQSAATARLGVGQRTGETGLLYPGGGGVEEPRAG